MAHPNHGDKTTIDGHEVEMLDCDGSLNCFVRKGDYSGSLAALMDEGGLWKSSFSGEPLPVPQSTIDKIETWALDHGY